MVFTTAVSVTLPCRSYTMSASVTPPQRGSSRLRIPFQCIDSYGTFNQFNGSTSFTVVPGVITSSFRACCLAGAFGNTNFFTTNDITSVRDDTGEYNSSPETTMPLRLQLAPGCSSYQIPVTDSDNDRFECRVGSSSECGAQCIYDTERPGTITTDCILDFNAGPPTSTGGPYLVNLAIEDFDSDDNKLSLVFAQFSMDFTVNLPADLLLINQEPNNVFLDTSISNTFTIYLNEDFFMPLHAATFTFVDRYTGQVFHTITTTSNGGQLTYNERNIQITPTETFSGPTYEGRHISILVQSGVTAGGTCQITNQPISDRDFWFVKIGKCKKYIHKGTHFKQIIKFMYNNSFSEFIL